MKKTYSARHKESIENPTKNSQEQITSGSGAGQATVTPGSHLITREAKKNAENKDDHEGYKKLGWWALGIGALGGVTAAILGGHSSGDEPRPDLPARPTPPEGVTAIPGAEITAIDDNVGPIIGNITRGGISDDANPILTGKTTAPLTARQTINIFDNGNFLGNATFDAATLTWRYADTRSLKNGVNPSYTARVTDAAGNQSAAGAPYSVTIDTSVPTTSAMVTGVADDAGVITGNVANGGTTDDTSLVISGTLSAAAENGETIRIYDGAIFLGIATVDLSHNTWRYADTRSLKNGAAPSYTARVADAAGNMSDAGTSYSVTIDTTVPATTATVTGVTDNVGAVTGNVANGGTTDDTNLVISGTLSASPATGESVRVYDGTTFLGMATVDSINKIWSYTDIRILTNGATPSYTARVTDAAGNTSQSTSTYWVSVDETYNNISLTPTFDSGTGKWGLKINGILDKSFDYNKKLEISTDNGKIWQEINIDYNSVIQREINYSQSDWQGKSFNYALGWAGNGFGLTGTQRGAPENIEIRNFNGRQALVYSSADRDSEWYQKHPEASGSSTYKNQDSELQDDFFMVGPKWLSADEPSFVAHFYRDFSSNGGYIGIRLNVFGDGNKKLYPGIFIEEDSIRIRTGMSYEDHLRVKLLTGDEATGWATAAMRVSADGDILFYFSDGYINDIFNAKNYLGAMKKDFPGKYIDHLVSQNDATFMISTRTSYENETAIGDLLYSKRDMNNLSWLFDNKEFYSAENTLDFQIRSVDRQTDQVLDINSYHYTFPPVI
ncbi:hypothetical protein JT31_20890 [Cedecea neteri]|uniref:Bacterial Ig-like domain-containing protein n=1 Tax=Cedecea neteri TaxID=158822 RepID=A0A089RKM0_9ENTR|nr:Ig-like domain-containing protein [Cedecea neteri]AIR06990.1 hypothetical protein JT31_20890 [Cedecea neteri]